MLASLHGGHSGQFCDHARDSLAEIVAAYHAAGFTCVGLSEHMPPPDDRWIYPDERKLKHDAAFMHERFGSYVGEAKRLQQLYHSQMRILVGMESEWYPECVSWVQHLRDRYALDYIVGSVHHVHEIGFDYSPAAYAQACAVCGGMQKLYAAYYDAQFEMLRAVRPEVVGHFDLIRMHDPDYRQTLRCPDVWSRAMRNLEFVAELGAVLDINARALLKGQTEPYVCAMLLDEAVSLDIPLAYGDDAHGVHDVGWGYEVVSEILIQRGVSPFDPTSFEDHTA